MNSRNLKTIPIANIGFVSVLTIETEKILFLKKTGWIKYGDKYIEGEQLADAFGIDLSKYPAYDIEKSTQRRNKRLVELV